MNIIIPIGGVGQRFKDEGYDMPKPLINVLGKPMIYKVIDNLKIKNTDRIYIIYHNHLKEFNFETLIKFWFPNKNISFIPLDHLTRGASETVLRGLETFTFEELQENTLILDCDTFYNEDIISKYKSSDNKNVVFYFNDTTPTPIFSYITLKDNIVVDIKEKVKISNNANTGAYGFENGQVLKKYCSEVLNLGNELYISHVYNKMIIDGNTIQGNEIKDFHCVGTPLQLKVYCNQNKDKASELRVCFDLDNTLVTHPTIPGDYSSVLPIQRNINYLKLLKSLGHTIIIYTARRMKTHKGNVGAIIADVGKITFESLDKFNIPYDEIHFGKPYANFYIDDLAVNANSSLDKAIGIYDTNTPSRSFNKVEYNGDTVTKTTSNNGEIYWYQNIPGPAKKYFPKVLNIVDNKITLENINGVSYSYLYINKSLTEDDITKLALALADISTSRQPSEIDIYANYSKKLLSRYNNNLEIYSKYPSSKYIFETINNKLIEYETNKEGYLTIIHGDPVFTNILKTETGIKLIDMRGKVGDELTIFGDAYYDLAKIYQSLIGYDYILNNIEIDVLYTQKLIKHFESQFQEVNLNKIKLITASLLFSLLPLHEENEEQFNKYFKLIENLI
jgi:capsule biosynthesis phosphatase